MRLTSKIALSLGFIVLCALSVTLLWTWRTVQSRIERVQEASIEANVGRMAGLCGDAWGAKFDKGCLDAMFYRMDLAEGSALAWMSVTDPRSKVLLHSEFLRNDFSERGTVLQDPELRRLVEQPEPFRYRKDGLSYFGAPIMSNGIKQATLIAAYNGAQLESTYLWVRAETQRQIATACLFGGVLCVLIALALAHHLLSPLDEIAQTAAQVGRGDFKARAPEGRSDEIGELAARINRMIGDLAELDDLKESFIAKITHDLKTPLSAIEAELSNLLAGYKGTLSNEQKEELGLVRENGRMLADLINHILEVAQLEAGRAKFEKLPVDVESEIGSVLDLLKARADEFGVQLGTELDPALAEIHADPEAFRRLLMNLISNALKFTPKGGRISVKSRKSSENEAVFSVVDTGIGIPKDRVGNLFKKFSQVPETRNKVREAGGSGLGLLICKEIVEAHGGRIWAESQLFRGTSVSFALPLSAKAPVAPTP